MVITIFSPFGISLRAGWGVELGMYGKHTTGNEYFYDVDTRWKFSTFIQFFFP